MSPKLKNSGKQQRKSTQAQAEEILELTLEEPVHGGACVARDRDGRVVFVRLGLPGELVKAKVTARQSRLAWADVIEVIESSPDRVPSVWGEGTANGIGGGELCHVAVPAQRLWKQQVFNTQLRRVGGLALAESAAELCGPDGPIIQPLPGDQDGLLLGRRTRAQFVVAPNGQLGMRKYRSHQVQPMNGFPFLDKRFTEAGLFREESWRKLWKPGQKVLLVSPNGSEPLVIVGKQAWDLSGQPVDVEAPVTWQVAHGDDLQEFSVSPKGFWQVHPQAANVLSEVVVGQVAPQRGQKIIELYSGAGLFSFYIARSIGITGRLLTVEQDERAVADAEDNLSPINATGKVEFYQGSVDPESIAELDTELGNAVDTIILDPPREGAGAEVTEAIVKSSAKRVVLVSCDPASAARDLAQFQAGGFALVDLQGWDLFPYTHHFETVATLTR